MSSVQTSATGTVAVGLPEPGQLVHVRSRRWLVENVERRTPSESPLVRLACADDHDQSQILDVFWDYEIDRKILCRGRRGEMIATAQGSTFIHQHIRILRWPRTIRWHCKTYGLRSRIASDAAPARRTRQPFHHEDLRSCAEVRDPLLEQRSGRAGPPIARGASPQINPRHLPRSLPDNRIAAQGQFRFCPRLERCLAIDPGPSIKHPDRMQRSRAVIFRSQLQ